MHINLINFDFVLNYLLQILTLNMLFISIAYPEFGKSLNRTNVPIIYDCDWPVILDKKGGGRVRIFKIITNNLKNVIN